MSSVNGLRKRCNVRLRCRVSDHHNKEIFLYFLMNTPVPSQDVIDEFVGVSHGNLTRVKELLGQYPVLVNAVATWGETPLQAAAQTGQEEIAKILLGAGAPLDICTAAMLGMKEQVKSMLHANSSLVHAIGAHEIPVMYYPILHNHVDIAELLLSYGADINAGEGKTTALHGAVLFGQKAMVLWLLEHGAQANLTDFEGKTPLRLAIEQQQQDIAALLRRHGAIESKTDV